MSNLLGLNEEKPSGPLAVDTGLAPDPEWTTAVKAGANWFYWIAALSLINSAAFAGGANFHFLAGLGLTELADGIVSVLIEQGAPTALKAVSILLGVILVAGFGLAGYYAHRFSRTAFLVGIVGYLFDALIVLLLGDLFMAGFHAFALIFIIRGYLACRKIKAFAAAGQPAPAVSMIPPGT